MPRIPSNRFGWTGFECTGWDAPYYQPMNGEGALCEPISTIPPIPINRYLNFPRKFKGEASAGVVTNYPEFHGMKDALDAIYVPAGQDPDPFAGDYLNLYKISRDLDASGIPNFPENYPPLPASVFEHACFPIEECDPSEYPEGYLEPPIPFISFKPIPPGGVDPGMTGLEAVTDITLGMTTGYLTLDYVVTTYSRASGVAAVVGVAADPIQRTWDTTDCPEP